MQNDTRHRPYWDRNQSNLAYYRSREAIDDTRNTNGIRTDVNRYPRGANNRRKQHNRAAAAGNNTPANSIPDQKTQGKKRGQAHNNTAPNNAVVQDGSTSLPIKEKRNRRRRNRTKNRNNTANGAEGEQEVQHSASTAVFNYDTTPSMAVVDHYNTPLMAVVDIDNTLPMPICSICEEPCEMIATWRPFLCDHSGHVGCMEAYLQTNDRCPVCRECEEVQISTASLVPLLPSSSSSDKCPVCLHSCNVNETWQPFACGHSGHIECMEVYVRANGSCPVCSDTNEVSPLTGPTVANPLHPSAEERNEDICPICLDPCTPEDILHPFPCAHPGHKTCMQEALRRSNKCPLCRMSASI